MSARLSPSERREWMVAFAWTTGLSAFLAFLVQPMVAKLTLPLFGGGPGVWATAMLFFQLVLLAGYGYAHGLSARLSLRTQVMVHALVLLAALACLPVTIADLPQAEVVEAPALSVLRLLLRSVGLPYFALTTTAPLLQRWFGVAQPHRSPYALYALSNAGSLLALLGYPFAVEPWLDLGAQTHAWSWAYVMFVLGVAACALSLRPSWSSAPPTATALTAREATSASAFARSMWLVLSLVPSWMLLAVTNQLCIDVASVPFLWVLPLAIYLLSFIVCFGAPRLAHRGVWSALWVISTLLLCGHLMDPTSGTLWGQLAMHATLLSACTMLCHGELARRRPALHELTGFYWMVSLGGALGGAIVAWLSPWVFTDYYELHLGVLVSYVVLLIALGREHGVPGVRVPLLLNVLGLGATAIGLWAALSLTAGSDRTSGRTIDQRRNFYGALRVSEVEGGRILTHGHIWHGIQRTDPARRHEPTLYYGAQTGVGAAFADIHAPARRIGVVGLGIGTLARYGRRGDVMRFYEIDPNVAAIAREHFTFLGDSAARIELVIGDGRKSLEREPPQRFDRLILDAFSSDAVPMHLLTREAMATYRRHLTPDGLLLFHVSNRYVDLVPVVLAAADALGLVHRVVRTEADYARLVSQATWIVLAERQAMLTMGRDEPGRRQLWTDARSSLFEALR